MAVKNIECDITEFVLKSPEEEYIIRFCIHEECMSIHITNAYGVILKSTEISKEDSIQLAKFILNNQ